MSQDWFVYIIKCSHGSLYTGVTTDVKRRFAEHEKGRPKGAKYLRGKGPLELVWQRQVSDRQQALSLEHRIKRLPREQKKAICRGIEDVLRSS